MKKTENKSLMMILGIIICWIIGAIAWGIGYLLIKYLSLKFILYAFGPFTIGFIMCAIWYNVIGKES